MSKLVVALGNPGPEYELTRHNIGWLVLSSYAPLDNAVWKEKFKGLYTDINLNGDKVYFLKPQTYMNLSGESIILLVNFFKIKVEDIIVVHDELDFPFGEIGFKKGGGLAGHNGLKSTASHLGTSEFKRLRVGIGRPSKGSVSNYVLGTIPTSLDIELGIVLSKSTEALDFYLKNDISKASNTYNKKNFLNL